MKPLMTLVTIVRVFEFDKVDTAFWNLSDEWEWLNIEILTLFNFYIETDSECELTPDLCVIISIVRTY